MAVNIMELMRQIQRDLANLHVSNRKINKKIDKQQVTIEDIQQYVKKNNMVLFGNDDTQIKMEDTPAETYKADFEENKENDAHLVEETEKYMENIDADQMQTEKKDSASNCDDDNNKNYLFEAADNDYKSIEEFITKELRQITESIKDLIASTKTSVDEAGEQETVGPNNFITDQINNLNDEMKNMSDVYQSDMNEMKEFIKESMTVTKTSIEEFVFNKFNDALENMSDLYKSDTKQMKESIDVFSVTIKTFTEKVTSQIDDELKNIADMYDSDIKEINKSIVNLVATMNMSTEQTASIVNKQQALSTSSNLSTERINKLCVGLQKINDTYKSQIQVRKELVDKELEILELISRCQKVAANRVRPQVSIQITPTYLNTEQIRKLNEELKEVTEMYAATDVFPCIEVQSGPCDHPVMKLLSKGVAYTERHNSKLEGLFKLGPNNISRSEVLKLVTEYPDLSLREVIEAIGKSNNTWATWSEQYNFDKAYY